MNKCQNCNCWLFDWYDIKVGICPPCYNEWMDWRYADTGEGYQIKKLEGSDAV